MKFNEKFIEALRYVVAHPENEDYKQQMESYITSKGNALEEALLNSEEYADLYTNYLSAVGRLTADGEEYDSAEEANEEEMIEESTFSKNKKKILAGLAALGLAGTVFGCSALNAKNSATQDANIALDTTEQTQEIHDLKQYRELPKADVEYDEVFDADVVAERETRIQNFLTHAKELGYGEDTFNVQQLMEVYTILNLEHLSAEEFAALNPGTLNVDLMMEHFGDFGIKVGEAAMVSTSDRHLNIYELVSDKEDSEYLKELEKLLYSYNDANSNKATVAKQISDLIWDKTVKGQGIDNATQTIGYYLGYYGNILSVNNKGKVILGDKTQFEEIFGKDIDTKTEKACDNACSVELCGKQSQFAESYTDTKKALTDFLGNVKEFASSAKYEVQYQWKAIKGRIAEAVEKVTLGTKIDLNKYRSSYSVYQNNNHFDMPTPKGQSPIMTPQEQASVVQDENGNLVLPQGETGPSQEEQTKQKQEENLDALRTEASSAAAQKAWNDAMAGVYDSSVPAQYARVADTYINDYNDAYNRAKAQLQPVPTPGQEETHFEPLPEPEVVEEKVTVTETTPEPVQQTAPAAPEAANYTVEEVSTPVPTLDPNLETIYAIDPNDPKWDQSVTTFEELPAEEQVVVQDNSTSSVNWNMMQQLRAAKGNLEANKEASDGLDISFGTHTM